MNRGLYIHIPFCKHKCNYCDFASFAGQENQIDGYLKALAREAALYRGVRCNTLYVGGGTPSLLAEHQLRHLGKIISKNFSPISSFAESTFEANPESLTQAKLSVLKETNFASQKKATENKLQLCIIGIFIVFTALIFYLCIASMTGSADILF